MNASHPQAVEAKKEGGPSRADGIKVPRWKIMQIFTGQPEGLT